MHKYILVCVQPFINSCSCKMFTHLIQLNVLLSCKSVVCTAVKCTSMSSMTPTELSNN